MALELGLKGKVVIVTGAAGGIGQTIVKMFAEEGANVVLADINKEEADSVANKIRSDFGVKAIACKTDVSKKADVDKVIESTLGEFNKIDILVNCHGVDKRVMFVDIEEEEWDRVFDINAKGVYLFMRGVLPHMIKNRDGKIVNFSSIVGKEGYATFSHYSASKFAITGLTQAVAKEVAEHNINVNAVCPGVLRTNLWEHILDDMHKESPDESRDDLFTGFVGNKIALKRPQTPEDIANIVLMLSSELTRNITGESIAINGGMRMD